MRSHTHAKSLCAAVLALGAFGLCAAALAQGTPPAPASTSMPRAALGAASVPEPSGALSTADSRFVHEAAIGGMYEVELGKIAEQKSADDAVKQFGARMVHDHSKANDELKQMAAAHGAQMPASLDKKHQREMERLQKLSGARFDRDYMKAMVADHKATISAFNKEASSGHDSEVKGFAANTLPILQEHLQMAETTDKAVKAGKG